MQSQDFFYRNIKTHPKIHMKFHEVTNGQNNLEKEEQNWVEREEGGEIGGSRVNFPLHLGATPTHSTEKQSEQPKASQLL